MKDYYKILGIPSDADDGKIKKAYLEKARLLHPDSGGSDEEMKELNEAYSVLSDLTKRDDYDREYSSAASFDMTLQERERLRHIMLSVKHERVPRRKLAYMLEARKCAMEIGQPVRKMNVSIIRMMLDVAEQNVLEDDQQEDYEKALAFATETKQYYYIGWIKFLLFTDKFMRFYDKNRRKFLWGGYALCGIIVLMIGLRFFTSNYSSVALPVSKDQIKQEETQKTVNSSNRFADYLMEVFRKQGQNLAISPDAMEKYRAYASEFSTMQCSIAEQSFVSPERRVVFFELRNGDIIKYYGNAEILEEANGLKLDKISIKAL